MILFSRRSSSSSCPMSHDVTASHERPKVSPPAVTPPPTRSKRSLLVCFALAAYVAWSFGAWEAILQRTSIRPRLRPVLLLVGDSLTEKGTIPKTNGWVTLLQSDYRRSVHVVPRGLSGYNTRYATFKLGASGHRLTYCVALVVDGTSSTGCLSSAERSRVGRTRQP
jgi:hypothetical protein